MTSNERRTIDRAIARLRDAWDDAGPVPAHHHRAKAELHGTWPTLARAIEFLLVAADYSEENPMTDQTMPDVTDDDRRLAREWAEFIESNTATWAGTARVRAAARVILRDVPAPERPTLADMTEEERAACTGMQADEATGERVIIIDGTDRPDGRVEVLHGEIYVYYPLATEVTPRPDLRRLEWPGDQGGEEATKVEYVSVAGGRTAYGPWTVARLRRKADTTPALPEGWRLADHCRIGRVIVTSPTPNPGGHIYFVTSDNEDLRGYQWGLCDPDELTYLDREADQ